MKTQLEVSFENGRFWVRLQSDSSVAIHGATLQAAFDGFVTVYPDHVPSAVTSVAP
jgi:hypothetical protein